MFEIVPSDAEVALVAPRPAVDEIAQAPLDDLAAEGDQPDIHQRDTEHQALQALAFGQVRRLQIKAMPFEVSIEFLRPHAPAVETQRLMADGATADQIPGLGFAGRPVHGEKNPGIGMFLREGDGADVARLAGGKSHRKELLPGRLLVQTDLTMPPAA